LRRAERRVELQPVVGRAEAAVDEADRHVVTGGDDQSLALEVEFREDGVFKQRRRDRLQHPALRRLAAPDRGEVRGIGVAEVSKAIHELVRVRRQRQNGAQAVIMSRGGAAAKALARPREPQSRFD
jgi:hypothetical protein